MGFKVVWKSFMAYTNIQGWRQVLAYHNRQAKSSRIFWELLLCFSITACLWQGYLNVHQYFLFDVKTMSTFESGSNLKYPAITIWPRSNLRRTVIGRHQLRMIIATLNGGDSDGITKLFYKINKTCYYEPKEPDEVDQILKTVNILALNGAAPDKIMKELDFGMLNRKMLFTKCYVNQIETNCEKLVLITLLDDSEAFTINLDLNVANYFVGNESGLGPLNRDYLPLVKSKALFSTSNENGFKFILNANIDEYCTYSNYIWYGAGFSVKFHDSRTLPSQIFGTSMRLRPGYQYNVALKPIRHIRKTEYLGKCLSIFPLYMFPESREYLKELCILQCENEWVWQMCKCFSTYLLPAGKAFAKKHNIEESKISLACLGGNRSCLMKMIELGNKHGVEKLCPQCKQPCEETDYTYDMTMTKFPPNHLGSLYQKELNTTNEESVANNYLVLNVYFASSSTEVLVEYQKFTLRDMFIYIGNTVILFLGVSFMTFGEVLQLFLELLQIGVVNGIKICRQKLKRKTKVKRVTILQQMNKNDQLMELNEQPKMTLDDTRM